ncbi:phosphatase PAP2 family protein [Dactylosporangium sp. NPDC050688]|uniref:phosphatase PAP2 family protein n=1 Tax=Dactylosporangium sp. NPDC050688 TaxID=3157217 RepID=UPI0033D971F9
MRPSPGTALVTVAVAGAGLLLVSPGPVGPIGQVSTGQYRHIAAVVAAAPGWVAPALDGAGTAGLLGLLVLLAFAIRRGAAGPVRGLRPGVLAGVVAAYLAGELLKRLVAEERPCRAVVAAVTCPPPGRWSFPSNHATTAAALASAVLLLSPRYRWAAPVLALVVAAARLLTGVHYPHDVAGGLLLGVTVTVAVCVMAQAVAARRGSAPAEP